MGGIRVAMTDNSSRIPIFLRRVGEQVIAAVNLDYYMKNPTDSIPRLLDEVARRYLRTVALCKKNIAKALAGNKAAALAVGREYVNFVDGLSKLSPALAVVNLASILSEDLEIDRNTLDAYILAYRSLGLKTTDRGSPKQRVEQILRNKARPLSPRDIALLTGLNYNTTRRLIREMVSEGIVTPVGRGLYVLRGG